MGSASRFGAGHVLALYLALPVAGGSGLAQKVPTERVRRGDLELKVHAKGELRPARSVMLVAPPVGGGALRIVRLVKTGTFVKANEVVIEFDRSEQHYKLEQSRSELQQAEQEIAKAKADAAVRAAQDESALVKARYDVRQAELDVSKNELVSAIDARKNLLKLEEARRALAQLEQDINSHAASNQAVLAVAKEKRHKARLAMVQAQQNIDAMRVRSPINGMVEVRPNEAAAGGFFFSGQTLPEYREGDQAFPGNFVAQVLEAERMELQAKLSESDRASVRLGQPVSVRVDALPGVVLSAKVKTLAGSAASNMWGGDPTRRFDLTVELDKFDPRLRPGLTAQLVIAGDLVKGVLYLPRQAIFQKGGKPIVYVKVGVGFEARDAQIKYQTESRVVVENLAEGAEVALVNPEEAVGKAKGSERPLAPPSRGGIS